MPLSLYQLVKDIPYADQGFQFFEGGGVGRYLQLAQISITIAAYIIMCTAMVRLAPR